MVAARAEFLGAGHYAPLVRRLAALAAEVAPDEGIVLDAGANIGHYLAAVLDTRPGLALDLSAIALRRAARARPGIGAVVWDIWRPWPVQDGCAGLLLNVFAPRNGAEFRRVLRADGALLVVTPGPEHLAELGARIRHAHRRPGQGPQARRQPGRSTSPRPRGKPSPCRCT